ncbi:DNA polymerase-3 subunit beta [Rhizobiales bacterium GAS188]|nr:DNA polymerase-3 subunit beta [Rhizobiales bacterium GAS188]
MAKAAAKPRTKKIEDEAPITLRVSRADLADALSLAIGAVKKTNVIPILSNVMLEVEAGEMRITASDLDMQVRAGVAVEGLPFGTTVPAHTLSEIVRSLPEGAVITMAMSEDGHRLEVGSGRSRWKLPAIQVEDFPDIDQEGDPVAFKVPAAALTELIERTEFAMASDATRPYLCGIYLHRRGEGQKARLHAVATHGHVLSHFNIEAIGDLPEFPSIILPRMAVPMLKRLCAAAQDDITLEFYCPSGHPEIATRLSITSGGKRLTTKLVDGSFPDYQRVIQPDGPIAVTIDREEALAEIKRVVILANSESKTIKIEGADTTLHISVRESERGFSEGEMAAEIEGGEALIALNADYLVGALSTMTTESAVLRLQAADRPIKLYERDGSDALLIIMPLRF